MVIELAELETIELRIALQWLGYTMGAVIAEAAIPSIGVSSFLILVGAWSISRSNCANGRDATEGIHFRCISIRAYLVQRSLLASST